MFEQESKRKADAVAVDSLVAKGLVESYDDNKNFLKQMKGPFYRLISKEGIREDDLVNCAQNDLIESANQEVMRVLVVGKPRSGKTTLAKSLEERLDLVRIAPEIWIQNLFKKIQDRIDNPPEEPEMETDTEAEEEATRAAEEAKAAKLAAKEAAEAEGEEAAEEAKGEEEEEERPKIMREKRWLDDLETAVRDTF